MKSKPEESKWM